MSKQENEIYYEYTKKTPGNQELTLLNKAKIQMFYQLFKPLISNRIDAITKQPTTAT